MSRDSYADLVASLTPQQLAGMRVNGRKVGEARERRRVQPIGKLDGVGQSETVRMTLGGFRSIAITLSLPPQPLWQNRPCHWSKKAKATKAYREEALSYALQALNNQPPPMWTKAVGQLTFYWPNKIRRDVRNAEAAMKAAIDGLVDAGIIVDDCASVLSWDATVFAVDVETPRVHVTIRPVEGSG